MSHYPLSTHIEMQKTYRFWIGIKRIRASQVPRHNRMWRHRYSRRCYRYADGDYCLAFHYLTFEDMVEAFIRVCLWADEHGHPLPDMKMGFK